MGDVPRKLDADDPDQVDSGIRPATATFIEAAVGAPDAPQRLLIFSGQANVNFEIPGDEQSDNTTESEQVEVILEKNLTDRSDFLGSTTYASLASVNNDQSENDSFGYRVTEARTILRPDGALRLIARVAVGFDAVFLRMSYQIMVLVKAPH